MNVRQSGAVLVFVKALALRKRGETSADSPRARRGREPLRDLGRSPEIPDERAGDLAAKVRALLDFASFALNRTS
jgi:hypothetical protein